MTTMKRLLPALACLACLTPPGFALAEEGSSLGRVRSQMNAGTWDGIVLIKARPKTAPAPASGAQSAAASAPALTAVTPPQPSPPAAQGPSVFERMRALLGGEPLSGQPLNDAKHLDSPSQGIALPTASTAARAASGASTPRR
jgi:hypothetical protein